MSVRQAPPLSMPVKSALNPIAGSIRPRTRAVAPAPLVMPAWPTPVLRSYAAGFSDSVPMRRRPTATFAGIPAGRLTSPAFAHPDQRPAQRMLSRSVAATDRTTQTNAPPTKPGSMSRTLAARFPLGPSHVAIASAPSARRTAGVTFRPALPIQSSTRAQACLRNARAYRRAAASPTSPAEIHAMSCRAGIPGSRA